MISKRTVPRLGMNRTLKDSRPHDLITAIERIHHGETLFAPSILTRLIQHYLDILRVIGNNAVHPGELDLKDDTNIANALFDVLNLIVESMITQPRRVKELYGRLPQGAVDAI